MAPVPPTHDYYFTLEVKPSASHDEIKASYRRLALLHHPDKNPGCGKATANMKLINAAWEALQDAVTRSEYDRTRLHSNTSSGARPDRPKPSPTANPKTPKPSYQAPPRADTKTQDEERAQSERDRKWQEEVRAQEEKEKRRQDEAQAQAESNKKRQEWLNFEKYQEQRIRQCQNVIKPLEAAVAALNTKIDENRTRLANDVPYVWNVFSFLSKRMSEEEKNEIRLGSIQAENAIRIKRIPLDKEKLKLQIIKDELTRKSNQEELRLSIERAEKERKERAAKEKAERARQREKAKQREEQEANDKAAREAAERARQEQMKAQEARNKAAREAAERARREQTKAQMARDKAAKETAERESKQQWKRWEEQRVRQEAEDAARRVEQEKLRQQEAADRARARIATCKHKGWWEDLQGQYTCAHCTRSLHKFASQCPNCRTIACASCRHKLKQGVKPPSTYQPEPRGNTRTTKGKGRSTTAQPRPDSSSYNYDPFDHAYDDY